MVDYRYSLWLLYWIDFVTMIWNYLLKFDLNSSIEMPLLWFTISTTWCFELRLFLFFSHEFKQDSCTDWCIWHMWTWTAMTYHAMTDGTHVCVSPQNSLQWINVKRVLRLQWSWLQMVIITMKDMFCGWNEIDLRIVLFIHERKWVLHF